MRNIILIGMPGAGKSTLGVPLADALGYDFIDMDRVIESTYGGTLKSLIEKHGPEGFVTLEGKTILSLHTNDTVIATGGSAVYSAKAMEYLRDGNMTVYLHAPIEELRGRIGDMITRGVVMLSHCHTLDDLYRERAVLYEAYADLTVEMARRTPKQSLEKLLADVKNQMEKRGWRIRKDG